MNPNAMIAIDRVIIDLKEKLYNDELNSNLTLMALSNIKDGDLNFNYNNAPPEEIAGLIKRVEVPAMQATFVREGRVAKRKFPNAKNVLSSSGFKEFGANPTSTEEKIIEIYDRTCSINFVEWLNLFPGEMEDKTLTKSQIIHVLNESINDFYINSRIFVLAKRFEYQPPKIEDNLVIVIIKRNRDDGKLSLSEIRAFKEGDPFIRELDRMFIIPQLSK